MEASLQLSVYSYATGLLGYADPEEVRLRFDVLTKTKQPELHRYWTTRDRPANVRLFRLAAEVLRAIEAGVFPPRPQPIRISSTSLTGARAVRLNTYRFVSMQRRELCARAVTMSIKKPGSLQSPLSEVSRSAPASGEA